MVSHGTKITKIEVQKKNKDRVNIYIDNDYAFSCSSELVYTHGIKAGIQIEVDVLKALVEEDNYLKCKNTALKVIERSYKSEKELSDKLLEKGYEEKSVLRVVNFLKSYNFLNDAQYAEMFIKDKIKVQGRNKIKFSLMKKGIEEDIINEKLSSIDVALEISTALAMAEKKLKLLRKSETNKRAIYKKIWDLLLRNGFDKNIAEEVINKLDSFEIEELPEIEKKVDIEELYSLTEKRYSILRKSESEDKKIYKKLGDYLLRKGYPWEVVKTTLKRLITHEEFEE